MQYQACWYDKKGELCWSNLCSWGMAQTCVDLWRKLGVAAWLQDSEGRRIEL